MRPILFAVILVSLTVACAAGGPSAAPASRLILLDGGTVVEQGGRLDLYDAESRRTGWGRVNGDGSMELFTPSGERLGTVSKDGRTIWLDRKVRGKP